MTDQLTDSVEDLSGVWLPHPPIRCATLVPAVGQDGPDGGQDGREGPEAGTEPSEAGSGPQTGTERLHARVAAAIHDCPGLYPDDIATALLPVIEREIAQLRRERDMALNAASQARRALETKENR